MSMHVYIYSHAGLDTYIEYEGRAIRIIDTPLRISETQHKKEFCSR